MAKVNCPACGKLMGPDSSRLNKTKTRRIYHCSLCGNDFEKKV